MKELNMLEEEFLEIIDFDLNVTLEEYTQLHTELGIHFKAPLTKVYKDIIDEIYENLQSLEQRHNNGELDRFIDMLPPLSNQPGARQPQIESE